MFRRINIKGFFSNITVFFLIGKVVGVLGGRQIINNLLNYNFQFSLQSTCSKNVEEWLKSVFSNFKNVASH